MLIIQNNVGNKYSPTVIVAAITSQVNKAKLPTHVEIVSSAYSLPKNSVVLCEQIRTIDKKRLREKLGYRRRKHAQCEQRIKGFGRALGLLNTYCQSKALLGGLCL